ncbi:hypothetical protein GCM10027589_03700 [Actinocorallia lasiicapitis]
MTGELSAADVSGYLESSGWVRQPERWRGASVWILGDDHEVVVPDGDRFADGARRLQEIVGVLARLERRPRELVAADIATPMADLQWYRTPAIALNGQIGLGDTVTALSGARDVLSAAARVAHSGPSAVFDGAAPAPVRELLQGACVGPVIASEGTMLVRVPVQNADGSDLGRRALLLLQRTLPLLSDAAGSALRSKDYRIFDETVAEGVSAELCGALAQLGGSGSGTGFEIGFRWARAAPPDVPATVVEFEAGAGQVLRTVKHRLRRLRQRRASISGFIRALSDDRSGNRFRVKVQGRIAVDGTATHRSVWVRLPDEATYDEAISAHRAGGAVLVEGTLREVNGSHELVADLFEPMNEET